jgi:hypothetical protein
MERPAFNHLLHLLISVFMCGFWLPIWLILAACYSEPYRCTRCGQVQGNGRRPYRDDEDDDYRYRRRDEDDDVRDRRSGGYRRLA